ncbi:hypothetical protein BH23CHL8_BH23CHL8_26250 [soil metagenome]
MNVCIVCGETFGRRDALEQHWRAELHHPRVAEAQALDRARAGVRETPPPEPTRRDLLRVIDEGRT